jgi:hypothetical protein
VATLIVHAVAAYLVAGLVIALSFVLWGIDRVDPAAAGAYAFRPFLLPGLILLWPVVLWRWVALERRPQ